MFSSSLSKQFVNRKDCRNESHVKENEGSSNSESNHLQIVTNGKTWLRAEIFSKAKDFGSRDSRKTCISHQHKPNMTQQVSPKGIKAG